MALCTEAPFHSDGFALEFHQIPFKFLPETCQTYSIFVVIIAQIDKKTTEILKNLNIRLIKKKLSDIILLV